MTTPVSHSAPDGAVHEVGKEELEYLVAELAFEHGLSAAEIPKRLIAERKLHVTDHRVRDAMLRARQNGILTFQPPLCDGLAKSLSGLFPQRNQAMPHAVVFNDHIRFEANDAFFMASAELLHQCIQKLGSVARARNRKHIIIANAGGPSVAATVRALSKMLVEPEPMLRFISLSAVGKPDRFDLSPNYLAVRLAEIFGANHYAPEDFANPGHEYGDLVRNIDMLIGGVGSTTNGFLMGELKTRGKALPKGTLGDVFCLPFFANGQAADTPAVRKAIKELHVHPTFEEFDRLRAHNALRLLIVPPPRAAASGHLPLDHKDLMVEIALAHGLASHIVLYASMAERLINKIKKVEG